VRTRFTPSCLHLEPDRNLTDVGIRPLRPHVQFPKHAPRPSTESRLQGVRPRTYRRHLPVAMRSRVPTGTREHRPPRLAPHSPFSIPRRKNVALYHHYLHHPGEHCVRLATMCEHGLCQILSSSWYAPLRRPTKGRPGFPSAHWSDRIEYCGTVLCRT
jgi:hypothetical protein